MGHGAGGFGEQQAVSWIRKINPPSARMPCDRQEVLQGIIAPERELESPLANERTVTSSRIAAVLRQTRFHMMAKTPHKRLLDPLNCYLDRSRCVPGLDRDDGLAILLCDEHVAVDFDDLGMAGRV